MQRMPKRKVFVNRIKELSGMPTRKILESMGRNLGTRLRILCERKVLVRGGSTFRNAMHSVRC